MLDEATALACEAAGVAEVERFDQRDWGSRGKYRHVAVVLCAEQMTQAGATNLAATLLDALLASDRSLTPLQRGRILARRARADWMAGNLEEALAGYRRVAAIGREKSSAELEVRALVGRVAIAQMKGNYPRMRALALRAARLASRASLKRLAREAHNGLLIAASMRKRFDEALRHGWIVYQLSRGDSIYEGEILQNLGQVLLLAGDAETARAAFSAVVTRNLPARIILPALGGLALANSRLGQLAPVKWATHEVMRAIEVPAPRHAVASALLECATAMAQLGQISAATDCQQASLSIANEHLFHEIAYRAEELKLEFVRPAIAASHPFTMEAANIAQEVRWLDPKRLPKHVGLEAASM